MRRVEYMLGGEDFKKMTASHFMESDVYYYSENALATELINAMTRGGFGSLPIVASGKLLVGVVARRDILLGFRKSTEKAPQMAFNLL